MGQMEVGGLVMLDDGSFRVKSTGEQVWVDDDGTLRDKDGNEVDVDTPPKNLDNTGGDGVDFTEGT